MTTATRKAPETTTTTLDEPAILDRVLEQTLAKLDHDASRYYQAIQDDALGTMHRAVVLAKGIDALRKALDPLMLHFMQLQGSDLGFKTDKDQGGGYPKDTVRDCLITGFLLGVYPTGNMLNIIAGRCYVTKNGWMHKLSEIPGLTDLEVIRGVPRQVDGQTCVRVMVSWKLNGVKQTLRGVDGNGADTPGRIFPVRVNQGMIVDAILGKAEAKALKAVYETIRGRDFLPVEEEATGVATEPPTGKFDLKNANGNGSNLAEGELPAEAPTKPSGEETATAATVKAVRDAAATACSHGKLSLNDFPAKIYEFTGSKVLEQSTEKTAGALLAHLRELGKE